MGGTSTLHVMGYGNKVEELAPVLRLFNTLTDEDIRYLKGDSVEGPFEEISTVLEDSGGNSTYVFPYEVSFDPQLGYPNHVVVCPGDCPVSDADRDETVTSLKIIKQGR